jgi:hypothetical protein
MNHELWSRMTFGVEFIDENGGDPGVRLRKRHQKKTTEKIVSIGNRLLIANS